MLWLLHGDKCFADRMEYFSTLYCEWNMPLWLITAWRGMDSLRLIVLYNAQSSISLNRCQYLFKKFALDTEFQQRLPTDDGLHNLHPNKFDLRGALHIWSVILTNHFVHSTQLSTFRGANKINYTPWTRLRMFRNMKGCSRSHGAPASIQ